MEGNKSKNESKSEKKVEKKAAKKQAKKQTRKALSRLGINQFAVMRSAYLLSLMDPFNHPGAKVPDDNTAPSFCCQCMTKVIFTSQTGAGGNTGVGFGKMIGNTTGANNFVTITPTAVANVYTCAGVGGQYTTALSGVSLQQRPVSAALAVQYLGSPNNASGRIMLAFLPPQTTVLPVNAQNVSLAALGVTTNMVEIPASRGFGLVRWVPIDAVARSYLTNGLDGISAGSTSRPSGVPMYGALIAIIDGCPVGQSVEFTLVENYEVLPVSNLINIANPEPSLADSMEMDAASNVTAAVPTFTVQQVPSDTLTGSPFQAGSGAKGGLLSSETSHPSFMDQVFGALEAGVDVAKRAAPIVSTIAALL